MGTNNNFPSVDMMIEQAVNAACLSCMAGIDEKIMAAINLGVTIGVKTAGELAAKAAIEAVERERGNIRKAQLDRRYHNTKLLLRNYRALNKHYRSAVFDMEHAEEEESFQEIMEAMGRHYTDDALYIESIKQSCLRTKIIMAHVNKMLEIYHEMCIRSKRREDLRRWEVVEGLYIAEEPQTATAIAHEQHIDKRTVYKDLDAVISDLTPLLFGISGVELK